MAKPKLFVYIPSLPQRNYEYRRGDSILIYDEDNKAILIDGGESELFDQMIRFMKKKGIRNVTFVLTHWHIDHDCGLKAALKSSDVFVDEIYCPPPEELKLVPRDDGYSEYNRAVKIIQLAKDLKKKIVYPAPDKRTGHWVGKIRMWMYRQKANPSDYVDYQVNNTSIQTYFPDLEFLAGGDMINNERVLKKYPTWKITGFKIWHHGNACVYSVCDLLTERGARICYYTDWEPKGTAIGATTFSKYGAGRAKQYFIILRPFEDIYIEADGEGHVTWKQGANSWMYDIEYGSPAKSQIIPSPIMEADVVPLIIPNTGFKGYNVTRRTQPIKYIVIHYVGAESSAYDNVKYFNAQNRNASADYFIDHNGDVYEYNPDIKEQYSWHCGGSKQSGSGGSFYGKCTNGNSVGIELCTKKIGSDWTFSNATVKSAIALVKYLIKQHGISVSNVIRHFDVNGKYCPQVKGWIDPVGGSSEWDKFKGQLYLSQIYRVRKSWDDAKSQIGAFADLENARAMKSKHEGYHIYNSEGKEVL